MTGLPGAGPNSGAHIGPMLHIPGVNAAVGLARVGGSQDAYSDLLRVFCKDAETGFSLLESAPCGDGLKPFATYVHGLKSGLANIGAKALSETAAMLEGAARGGDMAAIRGGLVPFRDGLSTLIAHIRERMGKAMKAKNALDAVPGNGETADATPPEAMLEALAEMEAALAGKDTDAMEAALLKLQNLALPSECRETVDGLSDAILFGNYKKAAETVKAILAPNS